MDAWQRTGHGSRRECGEVSQSDSQSDEMFRDPSVAVTRGRLVSRVTRWTNARVPVVRSTGMKARCLLDWSGGRKLSREEWRRCRLEEL